MKGEVKTMSDELRQAVETDAYEYVDTEANDLSWLSDAYVDYITSQNYYGED